MERRPPLTVVMLRNSLLLLFFFSSCSEGSTMFTRRKHHTKQVIITYTGVSSGFLFFFLKKILPDMFRKLMCMFSKLPIRVRHTSDLFFLSVSVIIRRAWKHNCKEGAIWAKTSNSWKEMPYFMTFRAIFSQKQNMDSKFFLSPEIVLSRNALVVVMIMIAQSTISSIISWQATLPTSHRNHC